MLTSVQNFRPAQFGGHISAVDGFDKILRAGFAVLYGGVNLFFVHFHTEFRDHRVHRDENGEGDVFLVNVSIF